MATANETTVNPENPSADKAAPAERKSWNFGHFGTRHDGEVWSLVRIKNEDGLRSLREVVIASNKSATPLVALARAMNRTEKRALKLEKLERKRRVLDLEIEFLEREIELEAQEDTADV